jgi:hypothetical protein
MRDIALPDGQWNVQYMQRVLATDPMAYWMLDEKQGNVAHDVSRNEFHGTYTGVTLGQPGVGDGRTCPFFDGANDFVNIFSAGLAAAFNGAEGSLMIWAKVFNIGIWTDSTVRIAATLTADVVNNYLSLGRYATNNRLLSRYKAGGTYKDRSAGPFTDLGFMLLTMTWSDSNNADELKFYFNGSQAGVTQIGLGAWAGGLNATDCVIGAINTAPVNVWHGWLAHSAYWNRVLAAAQIADLAVIP